jgi:hypothetical protein
MPIGQVHYHRLGGCRFPGPCSPQPAIGPADPHGLLMLAAHAELGRGEPAVDDAVVLTHAITDELTIAFGPDDKQRRRLTLGPVEESGSKRGKKPRKIKVLF